MKISRYSLLLLIGILVVVVVAPKSTSAHAPVLDFKVLQTKLYIEGNTIQVDTVVPFKDSYPATDNVLAQNHFQTIFEDGFVINNDNKNCNFELTHSASPSDRLDMNFVGVFTCPTPVKNIENLSIQNTLYADMYSDVRHFVQVEFGFKIWRLEFRQSHDIYPDNVAARLVQSVFQKFFVVVKEFLWLGMTHIWSGYDHILFLLSVIFLARSFKKILVLVTAFTIAHSITLIVVSLYNIEISSRIVEPAIALTIGYMALRNMFVIRNSGTAAEKSSKNVGEGWIMTFIFGLVHGLGFASALAETKIPATFFVPSLVIFNIGIEIGQLVILAVILPVLFYIDTLKFRKTILITLSGLVFLLSSAWFFVRVFLGEECSATLYYALLQVVCI